MKRISTLLVLLVFLLPTRNSKAQYADVMLPHKWHLGVNMGATWQQSDLYSRAGLGYGFTIGKYLWLKEGRVFSWDLRFRYLHGYNYGQGLTRNYNIKDNDLVNGSDSSLNPNLNYYATTGFIYNNYKMSFDRFALELSLGFNRLRERTGIIFNIFGGIGITDYRVRTDLLKDVGDTQYNFASIDSTGATYDDFRSLQGPMWSRDFESWAPGNKGTQIKFMPSVGITLGYQFTKVFSMGIEHKMTFALNDNIDGYVDGKNDRYHYSAMFFRFGLHGRGGAKPKPDNHPKPDNTAKVQRPVINMTSPAVCPANSPTPFADIRATIYHVEYNSQITFKVNGALQTGFTFNKSSNQFVAANVNLLPGNNIIEIKAANSAGSDYKSCIINYASSGIVTPTPGISPPVITVHNPATNPSTVAYSNYYVTATILNVTNQNQVSFMVNGVSQSGFYFNPANGSFSSGITLNPGSNTIQINAVNAAGSDQENLTINYQQPVTLQPPVVTIYNPTVNPYTVSVNSTTVEATVLNVNNAADIKLKINGVLSTAFAYNTSSKVMQVTSPLNPGSNLFEITATNAAGQDYANTTIIYKEPVLNLPPVVTYTDPVANPFSTTSASKMVHATVTNVQTQSQVNVKVNGVNVPSFSFYPSNGDVSFTVNLNPGMNLVQVTGTNPYGMDSKSTTLIYNQQTNNLPPYVTITYPSVNPYNTGNQAESIVATVLNVNSASDITFKANGVPSTAFTYNTASKTFVAQVNLNNGTNNYEIKAVNPYGQDTKTQAIIYTPPCYGPSITNISPVSNAFTVNAQQFNFSASVTNVTQASQVSLKLNNNNIAFQFDATTGTVTAGLNLNQGANTILLVTTNNCGQAQQLYTVTYNKPLQPPVVTFLQPAVNPQAVTSATYNVVAQVLYVANASGITYKVNGNASTNFSYSTSNNQLNSTVNLVAGNNTIEITGTNNDGQDSKSTIIIYNPVPPPCNNPSVAVTYPSSASLTTQSQVLQLTATVLNATQSQISVKLNGSNQNFTLTNNNLLATLNLADGANTIVITATNSCGTHSGTVNVTYNRPIVPPVVTITQPGVNPYSTPNANIQILAKIYHVATQQDVTFKVDGNPVIAFTYNPGTNDFTANYTLTQATTTFEITGTNQDGTDSKSVVIHYVQANPACDNPVITLVQPAVTTPQAVALAAYAVSATIDHVTAQSGIIVNLNGSPQTFNWNAQTKLMTWTGNLVSGINHIQINATNNCGTVNEVITITYNPPVINTPCATPVVNITAPASGNVGVLAQTITASVTNVQQSNITVKLNGTVVPFTYANNIVTAAVTLAQGSNSVEVIASNKCGNDSKTITLNYVPPCVQPTVQITAPVNASTFTSPSTTLTAQVMNVAQNEITVKHNGSPVTFTYANNTVTAAITLTGGNNVIQVYAENACGKETKVTEVTYTPPCNLPVITLTSPPANVSAAALTVTASVTNTTQQQISVKLNGSTVPFTFANGTLTASLTLAAGANQIDITATNTCGNDQAGASVTYTIPCTPPTVTMSAPANNTALTQPGFSIAAHVTNATQNEISVTVNGNPVQFTYSNTGNVTATASAQAGTNTVIVAVTNACGTADKQRTVTYTVPCPAPQVNMTAPATNAALTQAAFTITANVTNAAQNDISVKLNGNAIQFTYANNVVTAQATAQAGANSVEVSVTNNCGTDSKTTAVTYTPCVPPTVSISAPANNATLTQAGFTITAGVANATQNEIAVKVNGNPVQFTLANGVVSATATAQAGSNTVEVTATTSCGNASKQATVTYTAPCPAPTVSISAPANNAALTQAGFTITASVANATQNEIAVKVNGNPVQFTLANGVVSASATAQAGSNTVEVTATTSCGNASKQTTVTYTAPCPAPTVSISVPANNAALTQAGFTITASVANATQNEIAVKVNGNPVQFTLANGVVSATATAQAGTTTVQVSVTTSCGTDSKSVSVNYTPCVPPTVSITSPANNASLTNAAFTLSASVANVTQSQVTVKLNGSSVPFTLANNVVTAALTAVSGANTVVVTVTNGCGTNMGNLVVNYNPVVTTCGPRFNPGNSSWEFCLVTPSGTYTRDDLASNSNFTYSGPASSAFFKPIAGGGDAVVNGSPYTVQNGNYYLFSGNLTVDVSNNHPGSMGHWSICINSSSVPTFGNGNNRPTSPCESSNNNNGNGNNGNGNNGNGNNGNGNNNGGGNSPNFNVSGNGTVNVTSNVCATIKCMGEDVVYSNNEDAFVKIGFSMDNGGAWYGFNSNNKITGGEQETYSVPSGSQVALRAFCYAANSNWDNTISSNTGSQWVYVLKNGDNAPNITPASGQSPVSTYLAGVIVNGKISLGPNDVIYLFELRHVGNYGIDYQDAVMLITFAPGTNCATPSLPFNATRSAVSGGNNHNNGGGNTNNGNSNKGNEENNNNGGGNKSAGTMVTVCHYPNGPTSTPVTIQVPQSALPAHQAHGDQVGACPVNSKGNNNHVTPPNNNENNNSGGNKGNNGGGGNTRINTQHNNTGGGGNRLNLPTNKNTNGGKNSTEQNKTEEKKEEPKKEDPKKEETKEEEKKEENKSITPKKMKLPASRGGGG